MKPEQRACAERCLIGAESDTMSFPGIVEALFDAGFEGYAIDFRRSTATYYVPSGDSVELQTDLCDTGVVATFDSSALRAAIREAQAAGPDYTYGGFRRKAKEAGCAGYLVSFIGRRAVYVGRTGETHVERFP